MHARGRQSEQDIPRLHTRTRDEPFALDDTDGEPRDIVLTHGVEPCHFRRLTADERTAGFLAGTGNTRDHVGNLRRLKFADGEVVKKKQRLCPLHEDVVDTHRHGILPNGIMPIQQESKPQLGPDPIRSGNEHGFTIVLRAQCKQTAEAAQIAEHLRTIGCTYAVFDQRYGFVARIDVDTRITIGHFFHGHSHPPFTLCKPLLLTRDRIVHVKCGILLWNRVPVVKACIAHVVRIEDRNTRPQPLDGDEVKGICPDKIANLLETLRR